jgi:endonuclease-3
MKPWTPARIGLVARIVRGEVRRWHGKPSAKRRKPDPFRTLISCIISLRTKDEVTAASSERLFRLAATPRAMLKLPAPRIARTIFPAGFYNVKSGQIRGICGDLIEKHGGRVPPDMDALLAMDGVGRKTANLVLGHGFGLPSICVDTHVHRISNRLGWVRTKMPDETEFALREFLPKRLWVPINWYLVEYGKRICQPVSPWCSKCRLRLMCPRRGVERSR